MSLFQEKCVVWEQELYKQFKYRAVSKYFQTFFAHVSKVVKYKDLILDLSQPYLLTYLQQQRE